MPDYYVRSTDGNDANDGLTWATAKATLQGGVDEANPISDRVFVSQAHAEVSAAPLVFSGGGSGSTPLQILCMNDAAEPPTERATTATVTTTGASGIDFTTADSHYIYGITFNCGTSGAALITLGYTSIYERCTFALLSAGAGNSVSGEDGGHQVLKDCALVFSHASHRLRFAALDMEGGSIALTGTVPDKVFSTPSNWAGIIRLRGVDLSAIGSGKDLVESGNDPNQDVYFENCELGAGVVLSTAGIGTSPRLRIFLDNCDSADTQVRMQRLTVYGSVYSETTIVRTGGASNGATPMSHKMVSNNSPRNPSFLVPIYGPWMPIRNSTLAGPLTATVEILHDSLTKLTDAEVWLEVEYLGTSGVPLSLFATDRAASVIATPADQATSAVAWTTTGLTNPNKQKLAVTFTPHELGVIRCRVALAKTNYTVYVDPKVTVS